MTPQLYQDIAAEPYEYRGIINSEMALIIHAAKKHGIKTFIESGRARGQSTYLLAKYLPEAHIHSVEFHNGPDEEFAKERLSGFRNVTLYFADAVKAVPLLALTRDEPTAVLCDGPKGAMAVEIIKQCFQNKHVKLGFIHDMRRLDHGQPSKHREAAITAFGKNCRFSDDPRLVNGLSWMDGNVTASKGQCGPAHEAEFGSYGPTVCVILNSNKH